MCRHAPDRRAVESDFGDSGSEFEIAGGVESASMVVGAFL